MALDIDKNLKHFKMVEILISKNMVIVYKNLYEKQKTIGNDDMNQDELKELRLAIDSICGAVDSITNHLFQYELNIIVFKDFVDFNDLFESVNQLRIDVDNAFKDNVLVQETLNPLVVQMNSIKRKIELADTFMKIKEENATFFDHLIRHHRGV